MTGVVRWKDPPEHGNTKPKKPLKYQAVADELRANPKCWGVVSENLATGTAGTLSHAIRKGVRPWDEPGTFEARVTGGLGAKTGAVVYARFIDEGGE